MTADEYMESCLSESSNKLTEEFNNIRRSIRNFFPNRTCFVLALPAINKQLKCLETLDDESIDPSFREDVKKLQTFIYNLDPKYLNRIAKNSWDGNTFDDFLRAYIQDLSSGRKLEYGTALEGAGRHHNKELEDTVCRKYGEQLKTLKLPQQSKLQLVTSAMNSMHELLADFRRDAFPYEVLHYEQIAEETMTQKMHDLVDENSRKVIALCFEYLKRKHKEMIENSKGKYRTEGGTRKYNQDFDTLIQGYDQEFHNYDRAERCEALQKFKDCIKLEVSEMKHDVKLQEEKNKYEELRKSQQAEMEVRMKMQKKIFEETQEKERNERLKKIKEDNEKKLQKELNLQKEKIKEDNEKKFQKELNLHKEKMKRAQEKKLQEELDLQEEEMNEAHAKKLREELNSQKERLKSESECLVL